jgi:hypothetical protein
MVTWSRLTFNSFEFCSAKAAETGFLELTEGALHLAS